MTDVNHDPTPCEPVVYSWDIVNKFKPRMQIVEINHYEKTEDGMYESILKGLKYNHDNKNNCKC